MNETQNTTSDQAAAGTPEASTNNPAAAANETAATSNTDSTDTNSAPAATSATATVATTPTLTLVTPDESEFNDEEGSDDIAESNAQSGPNYLAIGASVVLLLFLGFTIFSLVK